MKKTPFYDAGVQHGADMRELFGYALPWEYREGHIEEHLGTRQRVSLCDLDYMAECKISGQDARAFVQELCTNDLRALKSGAVKYTAFCQPDGNMVDDGTVWCFDDYRFLLISGDESDFEWFAESSKPFNLDLHNATDEWTTLALQGPRSRDTLGKLIGLGLLDELRYYHFAEATVKGMACVVARIGYTGEFGYELHFDPVDGGRFWEAVMDAGSEFDIVPCGQAALESLRQEAGYPLVGNDHDKSTNPFEVGIGWAVKLEKESFTGKQALEEIRQRGVERRLVWFKLKGDVVVSKGAPIVSGKNEIGQVTSGSYSPTLRHGVAMGYVLPQFAIPGIEFAIRSEEREHPAILSNMPLYDPGDTLTKR